MLGVAVANDCLAEPALQLLPEAIAKPLHSAHRCQILHKGTGGAETGRQEGAFGAGAAATLVAGTMDQRLQCNAPAHKQCAHAFRCIELMPSYR